MLTRANAEERLAVALKVLFPASDGRDRVVAGSVPSDLAAESTPVVVYDLLGAEANPVAGKRGRGGLRSVTFRIDFIDADRDQAYACADLAFNKLGQWSPGYVGGGVPDGTTLYSAALELTVR